MPVLTVQQQRDRDSARQMAAIGLEAHLRILIGEILAEPIMTETGLAKLTQFQQDVQLAPAELKERLLDLLENKEF